MLEDLPRSRSKETRECYADIISMAKGTTTKRHTISYHPNGGAVPKYKSVYFDSAGVMHAVMHNSESRPTWCLSEGELPQLADLFEIPPSVDTEPDAPLDKLEDVKLLTKYDMVANSTLFETTCGHSLTAPPWGKKIPGWANSKKPNARKGAAGSISARTESATEVDSLTDSGSVAASVCGDEFTDTDTDAES